MTNQTDLFTDLANALDTTPDNILTFKQYPAGYTVILSDHRKVTGVQPLTEIPEEPYTTAYPPDLPEELQPVYENPYLFTTKNLRPLAAFLQIPKASKLRKDQLLDEISAWKDSNYVLFDEEE